AARGGRDQVPRRTRHLRARDRRGDARPRGDRRGRLAARSDRAAPRRAGARAARRPRLLHPRGRLGAGGRRARAPDRARRAHGTPDGCGGERVHPARDPGPDERSALAVDRRRRALRRRFSGALRWLRPPRRLSPTRAGWCFFALTFGIGFAALNTGNNLLYLVLSLMLAFLVLSGVLSESALRGVVLRRRLSRELYAER